MTTGHRYTLPALLDERAAQTPDQPFLYVDDECLTYGELRRRSLLAASRLRGLGIGPGHAVAVLMENCPSYLDVLFGTTRLGALYVPVNTAFRGDFLAHQLRDSQTRVAVVDAELLPRLLEVAVQLPDLRAVLVRGEYDGAAAPAGVDVLDVTSLLDGPLDPAVEDVAVSWNDICALFYTSGTTGPSKGAALTQHYLAMAGKAVADAWQLEPHETVYGAVPLFHFSGMLGTVMSALVTGSTAVLDRRFSVSTAWDRIRQYNACGLVGVGPMVMMLWNLPADPSDAELPIRFISAAPIPTEVWPQIEQRYGCKVVTMYGMTEAFPITVLGVGDDCAPGSAGVPTPSWDLRLVDDDDADVAPGGVGEIVVRPRLPHVMFEGYHNRPEATLAQLGNLWFHTGDLARRDDDGNLWFVDRKKDAVRRRGENISSFEVESVIVGHPDVEAVAMIGVPSPLGEEDVKVCVVRVAGAELTEERLLDHLVDRMPYFAVPRYVEFVEDLPRNATGRVLKYQLREQPLTAATWDREAAGYRVAR
jgi:crotonobetaine/carnitine-CoA ligase